MAMTQEADNYFLQQAEPAKSCLLALRSIILNHDKQITEEWKYGMPFYCYKSRMVCYLWMHKKYRQPYLGIVEGKLIDDPILLTEKRARMKILLVDATEDIPLHIIKPLLSKLLSVYKI